MPIPERPLLAVTVGEPAGVGPDICLSVASTTSDVYDLIFLGDRTNLNARAAVLGCEFNLPEYKMGNRQSLSLLSCPLAHAVVPGEPDGRNAAAILAMLTTAAHLALAREVDAIVTGPVAKEQLALEVPQFSGQTEYFAQMSDIATPVMAMVNPKLRVALATTHLPLAQVPAALNPTMLCEILCVADRGMTDVLEGAQPIWKVCGLNPHAGENGLLGDEENRVIKPAIELARSRGVTATGPWSADTVFLPTNIGPCDCILAMFHDQALPVIKRDDFTHTVNVTMGLPFVRTSVDHGTAYDLAATGKANSEPLYAALAMATRLVAMRNRA